jgi:anti-sigma B factor antagonist
MNSATRTNRATTIVDVYGHIDLGSSPALRKTLLLALKETDRLAINLAGVKYMDSSGIASLLEILKE